MPAQSPRTSGKETEWIDSGEMEDRTPGDERGPRVGNEPWEGLVLPGNCPGGGASRAAAELLGQELDFGVDRTASKRLVRHHSDGERDGRDVVVWSGELDAERFSRHRLRHDRADLTSECDVLRQVENPEPPAEGEVFNLLELLVEVAKCIVRLVNANDDRIEGSEHSPDEQATKRERHRDPLASCGHRATRVERHSA